jgi:hypothetical protein
MWNPNKNVNALLKEFYPKFYGPAAEPMPDLGMMTVENPDFFDFAQGPGKNSDGTPRPTHGFHRLPDNTLTPLHVVLAMIVARDGTIYATTLYPFTLVRIAPEEPS